MIKNFTEDSNSEVNAKAFHRFQRQSKFMSVLSVCILETDFESMKVSLHYGFLKMVCFVIFCKLPQKLLSRLPLLGMGSFGKVYEFEVDGCAYTLKSIEEKVTHYREISLSFYKEFFITCLADELGVGPRVFPVFGYDIIITEGCVMFAMEKCEPIKPNSVGSFKREMEESLQKMHSHKFVHLDIKKQNICFSKIRNRNVFIDFGLSRLVGQKEGEKSWTNFTGTLQYCSEEMKKCYILQSKLLVDLYDNDRCALWKTLS